MKKKFTQSMWNSRIRSGHGESFIHWLGTIWDGSLMGSGPRGRQLSKADWFSWVALLPGGEVPLAWAVPLLWLSIRTAHLSPGLLVVHSFVGSPCGFLSYLFTWEPWASSVFQSTHLVSRNCAPLSHWGRSTALS